MIERKEKVRLSLVDLFRAIAIFLVLLLHVNHIFHSKFSYDWLNISEWDKTGGSNFFFVVSGFMIYYLYSKNIGIKGKMKEFLVKRAIRIYPLYAIFNLVAISIFVAAPQLRNGVELTPEVIIKNFLFLPTSPFINVTWSLNHVVLFYIMFSLLIWKPKIFKPVMALWIFGCLVSLSEIISLPLLDSYLFAFHNLEIIAGAAIAYVILHFKLPSHYAKSALALGVLGYVFVYMNNVYKYFPVQNDYYYGASAVLVMLGVAVIDLQKDRELGKGLKLLSSSSYAVYITHTLFINFFVLVFKMLNIPSLTGNFLGLFIVMVLAVLSGCVVHLVLEKPMTTFLTNRLVQRPKLGYELDMNAKVVNRN